MGLSISGLLGGLTASGFLPSTTINSSASRVLSPLGRRTFNRTIMTKEAWEVKAQRAKDILEKSIPKQWLAPPEKLPPRTSGLLSEKSWLSRRNRRLLS